METFIRCTLNEFGKPRLARGEIEQCVVDQVSIRSEDKRSSANSYPPGTLYVTTHRVIWVSADRKSAFFNELRTLPEPSDTTSMLGSARIFLPYGRGAGVRLEFHKTRTAGASKDRVLSALRDALRRAAWNNPAPGAVAVNPHETFEAKAQASSNAGTLRQAEMVGIAGRIRRRQHVAAESGRTISVGFQSIDALEKRADALVQIAARFRGLKADEGNDQHNQLLNMMADMCIDSPVTREATGNDTKLYRMELARELSANLRMPVVEVGGIMTVADAYCLINRVRATNEYVSPADFTAALALFRHPGIGSRLTVFRLESGVKALKVDMTREPGGLEKVAAMAEEDRRTSISALEVMQKRGIPVRTALELLESAEQAELLVRDETTGGVRFFKNKFSAFLKASAASGVAAHTP